MFHATDTLWQNSHRDFLVRFANELKDTLKVIPPNVTQDEPLGELREFRKSRINPAMMDIAFAGEPIQCEGTACDALVEEYEWRQRMPFDTAKRYKYVMDVSSVLYLFKFQSS